MKKTGENWCPNTGGKYEERQVKICGKTSEKICGKTGKQRRRKM